MYHEIEAPKGKIFSASEVPTLERQGWVDTPTKFGVGFRSKSRKIITKVSGFLVLEYKWVIGILLTIIALYLAYLKL